MELNENFKLYKKIFPDPETFPLEAYTSFVSIQDLFEDSNSINQPEVEGHGVILYFYHAQRFWVQGSVSKTPLTFLKKALSGGTLPESHLESILLVRGKEGYPLSLEEAKTLMALISIGCKGTKTGSRLPYGVALKVDSDIEGTLQVASKAILSFASDDMGYPLDKPVETPMVSGASFLKSGIEEITVNGVRLTIRTTLKDDNDPEQGLSFLEVRAVTQSEQHPILHASVGSVSVEDEHILP